MEKELIAWGQEQPAVRAMVLTSSRAIPGQPHVDRFSDYDVVLALSDVQPFYDSRAWLAAFGEVLALYRDPMAEQDGLPCAAYVVQYEDGLKIDFTLWPVEMLRRTAQQDLLPAEFDAGYRVLLDKDGLTAGMRPPTYRGYIPTPPDETRYRATIESFFLCAIYVAKYLLRDDVMAAKHLLDGEMKQEYLLPMLEWEMEIERGWTVKPGIYGRRIKQWLHPDRWAALASTYAGAGIEENWQALYRLSDLFRAASVEVGAKLGFAYPESLDRRARAYLQRMKDGG